MAGLEFSFEELFEMYAKFGDLHSNGTHISLMNVDKWFQQAQITKGIVNKGDITIAFTKIAKTNNVLNYQKFQVFVAELAKMTKQFTTTLKNKLELAGRPGYNNPTLYARNAVYDRLTDITRFTGIHKYRFGLNNDFTEISEPRAF